MTIYTPKKAEKNEALLKPPQIVDGKEGSDKTFVWIKPPTAAQIRFQRRQQQKTISAWMAICILMAGLLLIVAGAYATYRLFHAMGSNDDGKIYFACTVEMPDEDPRYQPFKENIEFDKDLKQYEKITVPSIDEFEEATVLHDFERDWTAIIDPIHQRCFVSPLNKSTIAPPRDFYDLLRKLRSGYYLPNTKVLQERFRVVEPPVSDYRPYGFYIYMECFDKVTYQLEPITGPVNRLEKREAVQVYRTHFSSGTKIIDFEVEMA